MGLILVTVPLTSAPVDAQDSSKLRVIAFGAHPDDCDELAGGVAAKYAAAGHLVKFVSVTNGDAGHYRESGEALVRRRRAEAQEAGRRIGIVYEVLNYHDGELLPTLEARRRIIREIREWHADIVLAPRPNDYHPDHRHTAVMVQDASYLVTVPNLVADVPALKRNPVFLYFSDRFTRPQPFRPDIVVAIDDVFGKKIDMLDAHASQMYEWLPWHDGVLDQVPKYPAGRKQWLAGQWPSRVLPEWKQALEQWYGAQAAAVRTAEAFEITEYGHQPDRAEIRKLFPFFPPG